jgi:ubiquinone/menaquinone biosynthesis C-methylase UbiE
MKLAVLALTLVAAAAAQTDGNANAPYRTEQQRRDLASRIGSADRDKEQKPAELTASLALRPGITVADIGTGPGYMLPYLSRAVGPGGRVLAEDVFPDMLAQAKQRVEAEHLANVTTVLGTAGDPKLPAEAVDLAFVLDAYHHFDHPAQMLAHIRQALKETGTLVIVEYYRRPGAMGGCNAMEHIRADQPQVIKEVESNGFRLSSKHDHIPDRQYVLIFRKGTAR